MTSVETKLQNICESRAYQADVIAEKITSPKYMLLFSIIACVLVWICNSTKDAIIGTIIVAVIFALSANNGIRNLYAVICKYILFVFYKLLGYLSGNIIYILLSIAIMTGGVWCTMKYGDVQSVFPDVHGAEAMVNTIMDTYIFKLFDYFDSLSAQPESGIGLNKILLPITALFFSYIAWALCAYQKKHPSVWAERLFYAGTIVMGILQLACLVLCPREIPGFTKGTWIILSVAYLLGAVPQFICLKELYGKLSSRRSFENSAVMVFVHMICLTIMVVIIAVFHAPLFVVPALVLQYILMILFQKQTAKKLCANNPSFLFLITMNILFLSTWYIYIPAAIGLIGTILSFVVSLILPCIAIYAFFSMASYKPKPIGVEAQIEVNGEIIDGRKDNNTFYGYNCKLYYYDSLSDKWIERG